MTQTDDINTHIFSKNDFRNFETYVTLNNEMLHENQIGFLVERLSEDKFKVVLAPNKFLNLKDIIVAIHNYSKYNDFLMLNKPKT